MLKVGIKIVIFGGLIGLASIFALIISARADEPEKNEIKNAKIIRNEFTERELSTQGVSPLTSSDVDELELAKGGGGGGFEADRVYTSEVINTDFIFNAIGAHWKFDQPEDTKIKIEIRVSDGAIWSDWQECQSDSFVIRDDSSANQEVEDKEIYSDLVFVENGQNFQYRVTLESDNLEVTPKLEEIEFHYIDSTNGPKAPEFEQGWFKKANAADIQALPKIISRTDWGCPQGETSPEWPPVTASKSYHVFHHTVTPNGAEPYSTVRAIWQYQYSRTWEGGIWGDIGYNYLVDQYGRIFKGRNGSDNVIGAHVYNYNTHSIGVAVLGDYRYVSPSSASLSGLSTVIGYSGATTGMAKIRLYGHRELDATACPGDRLFVKKSTIISQAKSKLAGYKDNVVRYDSKLYYRETSGDSIFVYLIPNNSLLYAWGLNNSIITDIDQATFESCTLKESLDYFSKDNIGRVYVVSGGKKHLIWSTYYKSWGINKDNLENLNQLLTKTPSGMNAYNFIKNGDSWYYLSFGKRQLILRAVFEARGYRQSKLLPVGADLRNRIAWDGYKNYRNGSIIIANGEKTRWLVDDGQVRFCSYAAYKKFNLQTRHIYYQSKTFVYSFRNLGLVLYPNGRFLNFRGMVYRVNNGNRQYVKYNDILDAWGETRDGVTRISEPVIILYRRINDLSYPTGMLIRKQGGQAVYFMYHGTRKWVSSSAMTSWGFNYDNVRVISLEIFGTIPHGGDLELADGSYLGDFTNKRLYLISGGKKRWMPDWNIFAARGYDFSRIKWFCNVYVDHYPSGDNLYFRNGTLFKKRDGNAYYMMDNGQKRWMSESVLRSWNYSKMVRSLSSITIDMIPSGSAWPPKKVSTLLGPYGSPVYLPAYSGKTAREQHLWLISNETASHHYSVSGTPLSCQNGMAGGFGAFGLAASINQERYHIAMRWNYCTWYEEGGVTKVKNCDSILKAWHRHKKLIVTNPTNGKSVVVGVEEAGPAIWTGRVSGLSPEAMLAIEAETNDNLTYYWIGSQAVPLGPIN